MKPRVYLSKSAFENESECYYLENDSIQYKSNEKIYSLSIDDETINYKNGSESIFDDSFNLIKGNSLSTSEMEKVFELYFLLKNFPTTLVRNI